MKALRNVVKLAGRFVSQPAEVSWFWKNYREWQQKASPEWQARLDDLTPCFGEHKLTAADNNAQGHYFLQDLWAGQRVFKFQPAEHYDVASRIDGFVSHVASFCPVKYVDVRALTLQVPGITALQASICQLPFADQSIHSLSSLHALEHVGLGRYGDELDPDGWWKGLKELQRVLAPGGQLLLGTPCGRSRVVFNAHRVFDAEQIIAMMPELKLLEFSLIQDGLATMWKENVSAASARDLDYGCGLFRFTRPSAR